MRGSVLCALILPSMPVDLLRIKSIRDAGSPEIAQRFIPHGVMAEWPGAGPGRELALRM